MSRIYLSLILLLAALGWSAPAMASGDFGCSTSWKLKHRDMTGCDNMAILSPGNDTRVNLVLLIGRGAPKQGLTPPDSAAKPGALFDWAMFAGYNYSGPETTAYLNYANGEGSRCLSNHLGADDFVAAVEAERKVPQRDRDELVRARRALQPSCAGAAGAAPIAQSIQSPRGKLFERYLSGAAAFYAGDYDAAATVFRSLAGADQSWIAETARYMLARVEVNRAQVDAFDEYGSPKEGFSAQAGIIDAAEANLRDYLRAYPQGRYSNSARGLLRRVYWLGRRTDKLVAEYVALFRLAPEKRGIDTADLAQEVDNKLLPLLTTANTTDPILLAVIDLARMRGPDSDKPTDCCGTPLTLDELQAQRAHFSGNPALFDYLLAAHALFVDNRPADVLRLIPDAARQRVFDYFQFSRQMLRGVALEQSRDRNARGFWVEMLPGATLPFERPALELALALHDERSAGLERIFAKESPVRAPDIREILLKNVAGPQLLRRQASDGSISRHERGVALATLLYKEMGHGLYQDFLDDLKSVPANAPVEGSLYDFAATNDPPLGVFLKPGNMGDYGCATFRQTMMTLAKAPRDVTARLCLAEFMRANNFDQSEFDRQPPADQLGGTQSLFPGQPYSRLEVYKSIIADPQAPARGKAYALYRAINCYAPNGRNECGGTDVPRAQRKAWFSRLKNDYPTSQWAQDLRYYW
ncbi:tetratricopeptide repeat protein [Sphingomonas alpina]|uniref:Outer membrane assembly lipoprotein YfiO n=1 Tax=Sphingomonas alpina TaxID=653931 RepID=A0A7H0LPY4_9SPHN|nr:outer membrane assembly lipoprotein YfiO [Sphingomonas alpina]QNQ11737.1 outer membrane assembly lipoprotein YfiO [Sphingomonas alpina]